MDGASTKSEDVLALIWSREESLGDIVQTEIVDLPEKQELRSRLTSNERFVHKLFRHAVELQVCHPWSAMSPRLIRYFATLESSCVLVSLRAQIYNWQIRNVLFNCSGTC